MGNNMWYKNWFDSDFYHLLYKNRNEREAEQFIDAVTDYLKLSKGARILDLPCGRGRHAVYLASKGFNVTGADLSANSIAFAKPFEHKHLHFRVHDMLQEFPEQDFDAVFNLFTSFGYFANEEDDLKVLQHMKNALRPGGILMIDFLNPAFVKQTFQETTQLEEEGIQFLIQKKIDHGIVYKEVSFTVDGELFQFRESVKLFELSDFERLLNATELQILTTFGSYALESYHKETSERMIILAKK